jgi:hypothetical protein
MGRRLGRKMCWVDRDDLSRAGMKVGGDHTFGRQL